MESHNKVAIITGATSGIGRGIAELMSAEKVNLTLSGRNSKRGEALVASLPCESVFLPGDVKSPEYNKNLVDQTIEHFGRLDMLFLSAGQLGIGKLDQLSIQEWRDTMEINLNSVFYILKYAIPAMLKNGRGQVVIIGSVAAFHAFPNHPAYTASKGALLPLVKQVALDYGPEIRINLISPAQVDTPLLENSAAAFENPDSILDEVAKRLPMKRLGTPEDIANAAKYLVSEEASWITGTNFTVDGGFLST